MSKATGTVKWFNGTERSIQPSGNTIERIGFFISSGKIFLQRWLGQDAALRWIMKVKHAGVGRLELSGRGKIELCAAEIFNHTQAGITFLNGSYSNFVNLYTYALLEFARARKQYASIRFKEVLETGILRRV